MKKLSTKNHWLIEQSNIFKNKTALVSSLGVITYSQYLTASKQIASYLINKNICNRERIGIIYSYTPQFTQIANALWFLNAVPVILNFNNSIIEIQNQIKKAKITKIIIEPKFRYTFKKLSAKKITIPKNVRQQKNFNPQKLNLKNEALILFTSGSSGEPKAVIHTFSSLLESCKMLHGFCRLSSNNIWLASLPNYHIGGFMIFVRTLLSGSKLALPENFNTKSISKSLAKYNPTHTSLVSTQLIKLIESKIKPNKKLKYLFLGGGPLQVEFCKKAILKNFPVIKVYGSTETCSMISALKTSEFKTHPTSVGKIFKDVGIKIINNVNQKILNKSGRLFIKSKSLFRNYLYQNKNTKGNYFETNDIAKIDKNGYLFIEGRKDDIIISGGENVSPKEVEAEIVKYKNINEAVVLGITDELWGNKIVAVVSAKNNISKNKLIAFLKQKLASYKIPKDFIFVNKIPKNEMGKPGKNKLLKLFRSNAVRT